MRAETLAKEHRRYLASIAWRLRKESRAMPRLVLPEAIKKAAVKQGYKFRGLR